MFIVEVDLNAVGTSPWIPLDSFGAPFSVGVGCSVSSGANLTYSVEHTFDNLTLFRDVKLSQTTTTVTVTDTGYSGFGHGLSVGDSVLIRRSGNAVTDGLFTVATVPSATTYTYTVGTSQSFTSWPGTQVQSCRVYPHATLAAQTGRADGNYAFNVSAIRLHVTAYTSGFASMVAQSGMAR